MAQKPYRFATAKQRALPDFLIIGAAKCGTTSMYAYISEHPQVLPAMRKEVRFFNRNYNKGEDWYRSNFPLLKTMNHDSITGEASPGYLDNPLVCERIKKMLPNVKMLCLLRNPTESVISRYFMKLWAHYESMPILEAMQADKDYAFSKRKQRLRDRILGRDRRYQFTYLEVGKYMRNLERYWRLFDRDQLLILCSEKFFADPQATLRRVFEFLEIDPDYTVKDLSVRWRGRHKKKVDGEPHCFINIE